MKKPRKSYTYIILGFILVLMISVIEGFNEAFSHMLTHLYEDFLELGIHVYILGWILILYGIYLLFKRY